MAMMMSIENHLVRLDVGRQSNSVHTYGVNCRSKRLSLPLSASNTIHHHKKHVTFTWGNNNASMLNLQIEI